MSRWKRLHGMRVRRAWEPWVAALLGALALTAAPTAATARSTYCSPSGDVCYGAFGTGGAVQLRISLFAKYFTYYRLCVTGPDRRTDCKRFAVHRTKHGSYDSSVRWARHFPNHGPGRYGARWGWGSGLGRRIDFVEGPSIHVRPARVHAGRRVVVSGLAGGCPKGDLVTLLSDAFPSTREFAGVNAVYARVDGRDSYRTTVRIPSSRAPGRYPIGARCGGGNFGVSATLTVLAP